eukprot:TRINITY_DN41826_c0_g1_i1.p1 TRINITY_DN41826_c0_g1~~TRINITY_DN41826_c0_g1_i1.p1  ORF type:complete len:472 (+),score=75.75 TRINITY_DN41826_c0_g1_i1:76-1491(+)
MSVTVSCGTAVTAAAAAGYLGAKAVESKILGALSSKFQQHIWKNVKGNMSVRRVVGALGMLPQEFPETLASMKMIDVPAIHEARVQSLSSEEWEIDFTDLVLHTGVWASMWAADSSELQACDKVRIPLSKVCDLEISQTRKKFMGIDESARYFQWAYPAYPEPVLTLDKSNQDHLLVASFLETGGFMYFNENRDLLQVKTIVAVENRPPDALCFKRHTWNQAWTKQLWESGRYHKVTLQDMIEVNAKYFAYLLPGETFKEEGVEMKDQPDVPHGGFAYLFHENVSDSDYRDLDCYFAIEPTQLFRTTRLRREGLKQGEDMTQDDYKIQDVIATYLESPDTGFNFFNIETVLQETPGLEMDRTTQVIARCTFFDYKSEKKIIRIKPKKLNDVHGPTDGEERRVWDYLRKKYAARRKEGIPLDKVLEGRKMSSLLDRLQIPVDKRRAHVQKVTRHKMSLLEFNGGRIRMKHRE